MLDKLIFYSFATLFFLTPLFWSPLNFELFEFNKMILVYGLTVLIVGAWLLKSINHKSLIINRTPLDIPLLLFLAANILATIFSIDRHTSIWGYYSRSNGGLLSIISYLLLYWALVSNVSKEQVLKLLKVGLISGFIVSVWGILEHFGISPSCVILRQEYNATCWVQDVQARVFATLGQPNWMASYLGMLIFPALYFLVTSTVKVTGHKLSLVTCYLLLVTIYLAFTFTYSRGATLGLWIGLGVFILLYFRNTLKTRMSVSQIIRNSGLLTNPIYRVLLIFLIINIIFGSALTSFKLANQFAAPTRPSISLSTPTAGTQLETGGTESGQIRLIVWQGALDIFKAYPIFGSGVETFAYSYYQFRPVSHNLVSEWDFLYNKAHNEFLNYLATTGIVGFSSYIFLIGSFIVYSLSFIVRRQPYTTNHLLLTSLLASYISYLISNFFGFSVVITAVFFFLFPAMVFIASDSLSTVHLPSSKIHFPPSIIYRHGKFFSFIILLGTCYLLFGISRIWYADTIFALGSRASESGDIGNAYDYLSTAVTLRNEPLYLSEEANVAAGSALALKEADATLSATLKEISIEVTEQVLKNHPKNTSLYRTAIRTYYDLSLLDNSLNNKLLSVFDQTIKLAPTDPKLLYNKAIVLGTLDQTEEAINLLNKATELKPNYTDAYFALGLFYFDGGDYPRAVNNLKTVLKIAPHDSDAIDKLNEWGAKGIATEEAKQ